jgi:uncharacterized membrane protein
MDQSNYKFYLDDGIVGRERLLPVPIAPAPMRRTFWSYFPRVTLPEIPTEALVSSAKSKGIYTLRFIAWSPLIFTVFALIIAIGFARILMVFVMWGLGMAGGFMTLVIGLFMLFTKARYPNIELAIIECAGFMALAAVTMHFSGKFAEWLPKVISWTKL